MGCNRSRHPHQLGQLFTGHTAPVSSVAFSDGETLVSASADGIVRLWDVTAPASPHPLGQPLTGHTDMVWSVALSTDGKTPASASDDGTVRLWDVTDSAIPRPLGQPLTDHIDGVSSVALSTDGKTLASASRDGTVRRWDLSPIVELQADPVRVACSLSRTGLANEAWERYVPDSPYHDTCAQ
jgi:eukaryotic-like serine/threonine-protein kinase